MKKDRTRTFTTMLYSDGTVTRYVVMRGRATKRVFNTGTAEIVATYELVGSERPDYRAMTARHATPEAPPVDWQR